MKLQFKEN